MQDIEKWLATFVNSPHFSANLETEIQMLDKPSERIKVRLELLSYVVPKVKGVDPNPQVEDKTISINYAVHNAQDGKPATVPTGRTDE
jgi:hypothetical protein